MLSVTETSRVLSEGRAETSETLLLPRDTALCNVGPAADERVEHRPSFIIQTDYVLLRYGISLKKELSMIACRLATEIYCKSVVKIVTDPTV